MPAHRIRSIDVQVFGKDANIEVKGEFMDEKYTLDSMELTRRNGGIELTIAARFDNTRPATAPGPFKKNITVTDLKPEYIIYGLIIITTG